MSHDEVVLDTNRERFWESAYWVTHYAGTYILLLALCGLSYIIRTGIDGSRFTAEAEVLLPFVMIIMSVCRREFIKARGQEVSPFFSDPVTNVLMASVCLLFLRGLWVLLVQ